MKLDWPAKILAIALALLATSALTLASSYNPIKHPQARSAAIAPARGIV